MSREIRAHRDLRVGSHDPAPDGAGRAGGARGGGSGVCRGCHGSVGTQRPAGLSWDTVQRTLSESTGMGYATKRWAGSELRTGAPAARRGARLRTRKTQVEDARSLREDSSHGSPGRAVGARTQGHSRRPHAAGAGGSGQRGRGCEAGRKGKLRPRPPARPELKPQHLKMPSPHVGRTRQRAREEAGTRGGGVCTGGGKGGRRWPVPHQDRVPPPTAAHTPWGARARSPFQDLGWGRWGRSVAWLQMRGPPPRRFPAASSRALQASVLC